MEELVEASQEAEVSLELGVSQELEDLQEAEASQAGAPEACPLQVSQEAEAPPEKAREV